MRKILTKLLAGMTPAPKPQGMRLVATNPTLTALDRSVLGLFVMLLSVPAMAFTAPVAGDLAFEVYDIVINDGVEGPIGAMFAVASVIVGIFGIANRNWWAMGGGFAGTTAMVAGEDIVTTVGFIV